jgi:prepilin-type N-terminal cleavage/methylation domain-containing protein
MAAGLALALQYQLPFEAVDTAKKPPCEETPPMTRTAKGFTLVEIMIVVAIIGILIAIAVPSFLRAREISRRNACQENQSKIDGAKQQWALETNAGRTATPSWSDLVGATSYIRKSPVCPSSGTYTINDMQTDPACSLSVNNNGFEHTFPQGTSGS